MALKKLRLHATFVLFPTIGLQTWQEPITIVSETESFSAISTLQTGCLGSTLQLRLSPNWDFEATGCILFGSTTARPETGKPAPTFYYEPQSTGVTGGQVAPGFFYRPAGGSVSLGLSFPFMARSVVYRSRQESFTLQPAAKYRAGVLLDSKFEVDSWIISPKVGFLTDITRVMWALQVGYRL